MNKSLEKFYVDQFIDKIGWNACSHCDEAPDFKIKFPDKIIGLEVRTFYKDEKRKGSPTKKAESNRNKWLSKVSEIYYEKSNLPIQVVVLIKSGELKGAHGDLASELVERNSNEPRERREFEFDITGQCSLKIWVRKLPVLDRFRRYNKWECINNHVGFSKAINKAEIQKIVKDKAAKLPKYKGKYSEVALLLVAVQTDASGMHQSITEDLVIQNCGFSSVYLWFFPDNYLKIG